MRNLTNTILILVILSPALLPIAPHSIVHALDDAHKLNHTQSSYHDFIESDYFHDHENDNLLDHESSHHEIPIDLATFYNDYLKIDLINYYENFQVSTLMESGQDIDYQLLTHLPFERLNTFNSIQRRGPPNGQFFDNNLSALSINSRIRI